MHHAREVMVGQLALAQNLATRSGDLVIVFHRASADADGPEQLTIVDDRQASRKSDEAAIGVLDAIKRLCSMP